MDVTAFNKQAWNKKVREEDEWTKPVSPEVVAQARKGIFQIVLTPAKPVPATWFPPLRGLKVLGLACGGGQQGPVLAAAGAEVTIFDNSPLQLEQDRKVAEREKLSITTVEGDMRDLSKFPDQSFDLIFHPCSNGFCEDIRPVWKEAFRVLKSGGSLLAGFANPILYLFDPELEKQKIFQLKFKAPYSDLKSITAEEREKYFPGDALNFGHTLEDQIGGQTSAGFQILDLYEDDWGGAQPLDNYFKSFLATRARKP